MKINSTIYKGIEYIQVRELPPDQQTLLLQSISPDQFIKILVEGKLVGNCLQFKDYELWFDTVYNVQQQPSVGNTRLPEPSETPSAPVKALKRSKKG